MAVNRTKNNYKHKYCRGYDWLTYKKVLAKQKKINKFLRVSKKNEIITIDFTI